MALTAVAFQDHLIRSLSLSDPLRPKRFPGMGKTKTWKKEIRAVVDTGRVKKTSKRKDVIDAEREYVLDPKPPPPSLAQKLGLVPGPEDPLSEGDWQHVKGKSNEREDSRQPCVICKEDFQMAEQVLLSCSHVFHRACLEAFERFTGRKSCPMCRKESYETRVIHEGAHAYRNACATKIQATWRGYVVWSWYKKLRETRPPNNPTLRKKFYEEKLKSITDRMLKSLDLGVNSFLSTIDASLAASREVFRQFDTAMGVVSEEQWTSIQQIAVQRGLSDCPICLTTLEDEDHDDVTDIQNEASGMTCEKGCQHVTSRTRCRQMALLSCSHVFHRACLEAFEEFSVGDRKYVCPVCRAIYQKKIL
ncbi:hypothetical protein NP493_217g01016 [Ridgeia piscesae]|uniref:RING-type domain-containing protein n=1 Tax=Ridgeia piscesae TaxID=27915 RepID=A0AAD9P0I6_RIDPI|nr:hypothetical protein NP493_217g01016 [Ridgeia piscesae]